MNQTQKSSSFLLIVGTSRPVPSAYLSLFLDPQPHISPMGQCKEVISHNIMYITE